MTNTTGLCTTMPVATSTSTTATIAFMPTKPKFRGIAEIYKYSWVPWMQEKTLINWTGLVNPTTQVPNVARVPSWQLARVNTVELSV